ncbi:MAG TPA: hypothetical protein VMU93_12090 [Caulobacteraceae bacterium]|nr:hypothetical protein [Caulobacteraceae bacterium]
MSFHTLFIAGHALAGLAATLAIWALCVQALARDGALTPSRLLWNATHCRAYGLGAALSWRSREGAKTGVGAPLASTLDVQAPGARR